MSCSCRALHQVPIDVEPPPILDVTFPMLVPSAANLREGKRARAKRVQGQRDGARGQVMSRWHAWHEREASGNRLRILITRIAPRQLDDDNLAYACKAIRDGVALAIGIDDGDPRLKWEYDQSRFGGPLTPGGMRRKPNGVRIQIWRAS